jgi:hypothetical protein
MTEALGTMQSNWLFNLHGGRHSLLAETVNSSVLKQDVGSPSGHKSILLKNEISSTTPKAETAAPGTNKGAGDDKSSGLSTQQMVLIGAGVIALYYLMQ